MTYNEQQILFPELMPRSSQIKPVNVASVKQLSPFRYPGGKTWFVPTFRKWIQNLYPKPQMLVEPFAGGGIISLTAIFERLVSKALMVELDDEICAVWNTIIGGNSKWLANKILDFDLNLENARKALSVIPKDEKEKAFQTILKNRTFHGGILAEGSGFLKYGENGKGIRSRWYPETIAKRIALIDTFSHKISIKNDDGLKALKEHSSKKKVIFFIDPPYTAGGKKAGKRLYKHFELDHEKLFSICETLQGEFLMTYDTSEEVKNLARKHKFQMRLIPMTNTHHATMEELIIGRNLEWMDDLPMVHEPTSDYNQKPNKVRIQHQKKVTVSDKSNRNLKRRDRP